MSGIYIPDVGLPQDRDFELWIAVKKDGTFSYNVSGVWHKVDRVAIPVPDHGRLIDADAFKKYISVAFEEVAPELSGGYSWLAKQITEDLIKDIDDAPTVIPASREG